MMLLKHKRKITSPLLPEGSYRPREEVYINHTYGCASIQKYIRLYKLLMSNSQECCWLLFTDQKTTLKQELSSHLP